LPLPIEEEVHTPGSPIIDPHDITLPLEPSDVEGGALPRKSSVLSSTTLDDDDVGENDAFDTSQPSSLQMRVPTRMEWNGSGDKVFVTGTFCNWERKLKLHRNKDGPGFSAQVHLPPGTHHVKFLVDNEMITSPDLPTTVDWTNFLVNYIEVEAPPPTTLVEKQPSAPAQPMPIPGAIPDEEPSTAPTSDQTPVPDPPSLQQTDGPTRSEQPPGPAFIPISASPTPHQQPTQTQPQPVPDQDQKPAAPKPKTPRPKYTNQIPAFLLDLDNYSNPEDEQFQRAQKLANTLPQPPSLPMFLSKSILNGATPHKDDASVLIMPNHTVLNHLATSSIRSGVIATSGTTRYKRKVGCEELHGRGQC
jgi:hypothetical protein